MGDFSLDYDNSSENLYGNAQPSYQPNLLSNTEQNAYQGAVSSEDNFPSFPIDVSANASNSDAHFDTASSTQNLGGFSSGATANDFAQQGSASTGLNGGFSSDYSQNRIPSIETQQNAPGNPSTSTTQETIQQPQVQAGQARISGLAAPIVVCAKNYTPEDRAKHRERRERRNKQKAEEEAKKRNCASEVANPSNVTVQQDYGMASAPIQAPPISQDASTASAGSSSLQEVADSSLPLIPPPMPLQNTSSHHIPSPLQQPVQTIPTFPVQPTPHLTQTEVAAPMSGASLPVNPVVSQLSATPQAHQDQIHQQLAENGMQLPDFVLNNPPRTQPLLLQQTQLGDQLQFQRPLVPPTQTEETQADFSTNFQNTQPVLNPSMEQSVLQPGYTGEQLKNDLEPIVISYRSDTLIQQAEQTRLGQPLVPPAQTEETKAGNAPQFQNPTPTLNQSMESSVIQRHYASEQLEDQDPMAVSYNSEPQIQSEPVFARIPMKQRTRRAPPLPPSEFRPPTRMAS